MIVNKGELKSAYDVLIIGGGPAGLGAAMSLGRMSRSALICDDNRPRNAPAEHMNNFPSHDGMPPTEWRNLARRDLAKYETIHFHQGSVESVDRQDGGAFSAKLSSGQTATFKKVILAYGVADRMPPIAGFQELWGKSVFHCPYCHGFEIRGQRLGIVGNGKLIEHSIPMIYGLSQDLIIFTNGRADVSPELAGLLRTRKVRVVEEPIASLSHEGKSLRSVVLENGERLERDALFLTPLLPFQSKSPIGERLGCEKTEMGFYKIDAMGKTTVPGVFAAGDIMTGMHSVVSAVSNGQTAGAAAVAELLHEGFKSESTL